MQLSQIPTRVPLPFAENGTKNTIPEASQIGVTPGAASLNDGFPPLTLAPLAAGGIPPSGEDFNGILNLLSANTQWQNAGGFSHYNASFSTAIGGYPKTALLAKTSGNGYWLNLEDNNTSDPDTGGAGWLAFDPWAIQSAQYITAQDTGAVNAYAVALNPAPAALTTGMLVSIKSISNTNTGAATLAVNGLSTLPILLSQNTPLSGGELVAGYGAIVRLNNAGTAWELIWTGAGSFGIAATQSNEAVNLGQLFIGNRKAVFTSNGTYTVPAGVTQIWGSGAGGGGGGGGGNMLNSTGVSGAGGGGGFGGEAVIKMPIAVTPGEVLTVTIGAGGAGGVGVDALATAPNGVYGGTTTLTAGSTTLLTLSGGQPGNGAFIYDSSYVFGGAGFAQGVCLTARGVSGASGSMPYGGVGQGTPFGAGGGGAGGGGAGAGGDGGDGIPAGNGGGAGTGGGGGVGDGSVGGTGGGGILIVEW